MPFAPVDDMSLYYEVSGEQGSPLLMIHAYNACTVDWHLPSIEKLAQAHRVIIFDNRGTGQSDKPETPYTMRDLAADAIGILDALHIPQAHIFGVSMGGMIAQHVALSFPERVKGLILGSTAAGGIGHPQLIAPSAEVLSILAHTASGDAERDAKTSWPIFFAPAYLEAQSDLLEQRLQKKLTYPAAPSYALASQMGAMAQHDTFSHLQEIQGPTLVQCGLQDVLLPPQNSRVLAERIPNARLIEYPEAAHCYFDEIGDRAASDILSFLKDVDQDM